MLSSLACKLRVRRHSSRKTHAVECFIITQQMRNRTDCMTNSENKDVASIDIHSLSAMIVLKQDHLNDYQQVMNFFHQSLQRLEISLFIVDRIQEFPFDLFTTSDDQIFLTHVVTVFLDDALLTIHKLVVDNGNSYTLQEFRNKICPADRRISGFIKDTYRKLFDDSINSLYFDKKTKQIRAAINTLRNESIAHNTRDWVSGKSTITALDLIKFKDLVRETKILFDALSFDTYRMLLPIPYDPAVLHPKHSDSRPDIEKVLDSIARESYLLNMPEREIYPGEWTQQREALSVDEIQKINHYRKKFGLPKV